MLVLLVVNSKGNDKLKIFKRFICIDISYCLVKEFPWILLKYMYSF